MGVEEFIYIITHVKTKISHKKGDKANSIINRLTLNVSSSK